MSKGCISSIKGPRRKNIFGKGKKKNRSTEGTFHWQRKKKKEGKKKKGRKKH